MSIKVTVFIKTVINVHTCVFKRSTSSNLVDVNVRNNEGLTALHIAAAAHVDAKVSLGLRRVAAVDVVVRTLAVAS